MISDRRKLRLSLPLLTATVAGVAMMLLVAKLLMPHDRETWAPTEMLTATLALPKAMPIMLPGSPEPGAGPDGGLPADVGTAQVGGAATLPTIPDTPPNLDDVARELRRRRAEILELEAALALREAALRAAETDLEAQLERLDTFRRDLEQLVGQAEAEEEERIAQLVKMYENMRAKSAAAIFDRLEMPVILSVAKRMREAKMAAIMAAMDPNRARLVTAELARQRSLPELR